MSKYLPLFWDWRQRRAILYRIYINIFAIFLRIPILPMGFSWKYKTLTIYYKGGEYDCFYKKGRLIYQDVWLGTEYKNLKEADKFWKSYYKECEKKDILNFCDKELERLG